MSTSEDLKAAKALIDTPDKWIRGKSEQIVRRPVYPPLGSLLLFDPDAPIEPYSMPIETVHMSCATNAVERASGPSQTMDDLAKAGPRMCAMIVALYDALPSGWKYRGVGGFSGRRRAVQKFNDGNLDGHTGVMRLFDFAIAACQRAEEAERVRLAAARAVPGIMADALKQEEPARAVAPVG